MEGWVQKGRLAGGVWMCGGGIGIQIAIETGIDGGFDGAGDSDCEFDFDGDGGTSDVGSGFKPAEVVACPIDEITLLSLTREIPARAYSEIRAPLRLSFFTGWGVVPVV